MKMIQGFGAYGQEGGINIPSPGDIGQQITAGMVVELGAKQDGNYKCYEPSQKQAAEGKKAMCVGSKQFYTMSHVGALLIGGIAGYAISKML